MKNTKRTQYIILIILLILYFGLVITAFLNLDNFTDVDTSSVNDVTIVLDAGHGGEDGGAVANEVVEKDINLSITNILADIFKASGFNVVSTRTSDIMINTYGETLRERKVSDMKNRLEIFNENPNNIIISIHQNKFTQEKYSGTQVFYSQNSPESSLLAESIKNSVATVLQPENKRECKEATKDIYLLYNSDNPAVIVECGFISNYIEAEKLKSKKYQKELAFSIFSGFIDFYNNL